MQSTQLCPKTALGLKSVRLAQLPTCRALHRKRFRQRITRAARKEHNSFDWQNNFRSNFKADENRFPRQVRQQVRQRGWGPIIVPILAALGLASILGPLILALTFGAAGLALSMVAGAMAMTMFMPVMFFMGGMLGISALFGALKLALILPFAAISLMAYKIARKEVKRSIESGELKQRQDLEEKMLKQQRDERDFERLQRDELLEFDQRLKDRFG